MKRITPGKYTLLGLLAVAAAACYQPREGCLDVAARNYAVDADRPCPDDCCQYPVIRVDYLHKVVTTDTFNLVYDDSVYYDAGGNAFRFSDIQFYLSSVRMLRSDGEAVGVEDTVGVEIPQPDGGVITEIVEDNFSLINPGLFGVQTMGNMRESGSFSGFRLTLGVPEPANFADTLGLPAGHPLAAGDMYISPEAGRIFNRVQLYRIENQTDTIRTTLEIALPENLITFDLPANYYIDPGFSPRFVLLVDYLAWFRGVDLVADSPEEITQRIVSNLPASFKLVAVTLSIN